MKIGFIGCGKMGSALIQGVLAAKLCQAEEVAVYDRLSEPAEILGTESGVRVAAGNRELVAGSDVVLLCVKPEDALPALAEAARELDGKLLISIAAGITIAALQEASGGDCRVVRVMPNTAALVQKGA
jgi:pyrroline-5-carboxylate reductase